jgi:hypothetical protein
MAETRYMVVSGGQPRVVTAQQGQHAGKTFTFYDVFDELGGKWQARQDTFNQAMQMIGQRVVAVVRVEQRGEFTNYYLDSVELAGAQPAQQQGYQPAQQAQQAQPPQTPTSPPIVAPNERERQSSIHRQTAAKVAAKMSSTPNEFWENVQTVFRFFETGQIPTLGNYVAGESPPQAQRQNAAAYAPPDYGDPGPQEGYVPAGQDDIPF